LECLDPDPLTQLNTDPSGSETRTLGGGGLLVSSNFYSNPTAADTCNNLNDSFEANSINEIVHQCNLFRVYG
jgi:hypothetical protein